MFGASSSHMPHSPRCGYTSHRCLFFSPLFPLSSLSISSLSPVPFFLLFFLHSFARGSSLVPREIMLKARSTPHPSPPPLTPTADRPPPPLQAWLGLGVSVDGYMIGGGPKGWRFWRQVSCPFLREPPFAPHVTPRFPHMPCPVFPICVRISPFRRRPRPCS